MVSQAAIRNSALSEDDIKQYLKTWLESNGWVVRVAWGKSHGVDLIATQAGKRWLIEAKGPGSRSAMQHNYFLSILGEILQRMDDAQAHYSIAFPDLKVYRNLWFRLPAIAKQRTGIDMLLVSNDGTVTILNDEQEEPSPPKTESMLPGKDCEKRDLPYRKRMTMGKYDALYDYLSAQTAERITLTFNKINRLLEDGGSETGLPQTAYKRPQWWVNSNTAAHSHSRSWQDAGYKTTNFSTSIYSEEITFIKAN